MERLREGTTTSLAFWTGALSTLAGLITISSSSEEYEGLALRTDRDLRRDLPEVLAECEGREETELVPRSEKERDG